MGENKGDKVFIVGLDGATFDMMGEMLERNELPNIKRLVEN